MVYKAFNKGTDHICRYYAQAMVHKTEYGRLDSKVYFTKFKNESMSEILDIAHKRATGAVLY